MESLPHGFEVGEDDRGEVEGEDLRGNQPSNDDHPERAARLCCGASDSKGNGNGSHHGGKGGHEDGAETCAADFVDCFVYSFVCKVDKHDSIFQDDTEKHDDPNKSVEREGFTKDDDVILVGDPIDQRVLVQTPKNRDFRKICILIFKDLQNSRL